MTQEREAYVRYRIERARATLREARTLLDTDQVLGAVNRLYYACFYAVCALLFTEGKKSSKHMGVRAFFDEFWVKPRRVPVKLGRFYRNIFDDRQKADYADEACFDPAEVRAWFEEATAFVAEVTGLAERHLAAGESEP